MDREKPTIAIAGASGDLGQHVVGSFTSERFASRFKEIILLSRNDDYTVPGTTTRVYSPDDITSSLQGVHAVVNCIGSKGDTVPFKKALIKGITETETVKLYVPSEFGVNHYINGGDDADFDFVEWRHKKELRAFAMDMFTAAGREDIKIVHMFPGLLLELSIGPWFGMDCTSGKFQAVGSSTQVTSYTSMSDVGNALAVLASMNPTDAPEELRLNGDCVSMDGIAKIMGDASQRKFDVTQMNVDDFSAQGLVPKEDAKDPSKYLRVLIGNGKIDFSEDGLENQNASVNPGESQWKWKTMREYALETRGRPWAT